MRDKEVESLCFDARPNSMFTSGVWPGGERQSSSDDKDRGKSDPGRGGVIVTVVIFEAIKPLGRRAALCLPAQASQPCVYQLFVCHVTVATKTQWDSFSGRSQGVSLSARTFTLFYLL